MTLRAQSSFWRVWTAQAVSVTGDGMHRAALLWWAASTHSTGAVAVLALCSMLPVIVCSPFTGALADRFPRRRLMVVADVLRVGTSIGLAGAVAHGSTPVGAVAALTVLAAIGEAMFAPAFSAVLGQLLPEQDRVAGNALNLANSAAGGLLGPVLGGVLVAVLGAGRVLALDAATFAVSALIVGATAIPPLLHAAAAEATVTEPAAGADRDSGWRIVARSPVVRRLAVLAATLNLCTGPSSVLLVALVVRRLHRGSAVYGALDACVAAGILAGIVVVPRVARRFPGAALAIGLVLIGAALVLVPLVPTPWWSGAMFAMLGIGVAVANSLLPTRLQSSTAPEELGRVFGVVGGVGSGLRPLGLAAAGPMVAGLGVVGSFVVCGGGIIVATLALAGPRSPAWGVTPGRRA